MLQIALKMLFGDRAKYLGIVAGIALASILMIQQPGIMLSILRMTYSFITDVSLPNIWVTDPKVKFVDDAKPLLDTALNRVRGVTGVEWAVPLYKGSQQVRLTNGETIGAVILGLDDATMIGGPAVMLEGHLADLRQQDAVIVDESSAKGRLAITRNGVSRPLQVGDALEINDKRAVVVGIARTTPNFQSQPQIYTTYTRAKGYASNTRKMLSYVLVKSKSGEPAADVANRITAQTGLAARTAETFKAESMQYMVKNTQIISTFGLTVIVGFIIGTAVTGQIFYNFTLDNLRYFGVFKAMGASHRLLVTMIVLQALVVGIVGFGLGAGVMAVYAAMARNSGGPAIQFIWQLVAGSGAAVMLITLGAAAFSIRKVLNLEPAIVFKG